MAKNMLKPSWTIKLLLLTACFNSHSTGLVQNSSDIDCDDSDKNLDGIVHNGEFVENSEPVKYNGAHLLRISVTDESVKSAVAELQSKYDGQLWMESGDEIDLLFMQPNVEGAQKVLTESNITYNVMTDDLQKTIDEENPPKGDMELLQNRQGHKMTWKAYHRLADIHGYLDYLGKTYPDLCSVHTIGVSAQNRALKVIKISNGKAGNPAIWIDGALHAREWISPASVTYIIRQLVDRWEIFPQHVRDIDWHILPVLNPDGYEYTHTNERLWRKNRSGSGNCIGVDLNRNFGYKWGGESASPDPCSLVYRGNKPNSELETMAVQKYLRKHIGSLKAYLTFHSYGNAIGYPYGYDSHVVPPDYKELESLAKRMADNILKMGGAEYRVGSTGTLIGAAAGGSDDWAKAILGIKFSYCIELRGYGPTGFILHPSFIELSGWETLIMNILKMGGAEYRVGSTGTLIGAAAGGSDDWAKAILGIKFSYCIELRGYGPTGFILHPSFIEFSGWETLIMVRTIAQEVSKLYSKN